MAADRGFLADHLQEMGMSLDEPQGNARGRSVTPDTRKRKREASSSAGPEARSASRSRDLSGMRSDSQRKSARKLEKVSQRGMNRLGRAGESDRHVFSAKPKHLFSGKRKGGSTDRR